MRTHSVEVVVDAVMINTVTMSRCVEVETIEEWCAGAGDMDTQEWEVTVNS